MKLKDLLHGKDDAQEVRTEKNAELRKLLAAKDEAWKAYNDGLELISRLATKLDAVEKELPELKENIVAADAARLRIIDLVAMDKASSEELEKARTVVSEAKRVETEAVEMCSALTRTKDKAEANLSRLSTTREAADRAFWAFVCREMATDINAIVGRKAEYAWAANAGSGGTHRTDAIGWIFNLSQPPHERLRVVLDELEAIYREKAR